MKEWSELMQRVGGEWSVFFTGWRGLRPVSPFWEGRREIVARSVRAQRLQLYSVKECHWCGGKYLGCRANAKYCSNRCNNAAARMRWKVNGKRITQ